MKFSNTCVRWCRPVAFLAVLAISFGVAAESAGDRFEFKSYQDVASLFEELNYTPESWQQGVRIVPRAYLATIPARWRDSVAPSVSVETKKRIFFRTLAPLVLRANEMIFEDRERLLKAVEDSSVREKDKAWLEELAQQYRVSSDASAALDEASLKELVARVDMVPTSLVLAQAAEESGWGTSRFAALGNALFGQWTWGGEGVKPEQQREGLGDYKIAAFESPQGSVSAYMRNLNSHPAYAPLRERRAALRAAGKQITGAELVVTLTSYSERGEEYVKSLQAIMRVNKLDPADDAHLAEMTPIELVPVGEGVEAER